jgi:hypothetical protein
MFVNMLLATGVLIGAVAALVIAGLVVYHKTAQDRWESRDAP